MWRLRLGCRPCALLAVVALAAVLAHPERADADGLPEVLAEVYRNNPTIAAARRQLGSVNENVPRAKAGWRPTVRLNAQAGRQTTSTDDPRSRDGDSTPASASLQIDQPLYRGGRTVAGVDQAENEVRAERARLASTVQGVFTDAIAVYASVRRDRRILDFTRANIDILRELVTATQDRRDEGVTTAANLAEAESRLAGARARRDQAQTALARSRARFEEIVGRLPAELAPIDLPADLPGSESAAITAAVNDNPQVTAAEFREDAARRAVRVAEGALLPTLSLRATARRRDDFDRDRAMQDSASLTLNLSIPLYQAGAEYSDVRASKQAAGQRREQVTESRRAARQQAKSAWADYINTLSRIDALEAQAEQASAALDGARAEFRAGTRTIRNVLDAETDRINAQIQLARARRDLDVAAFRLLRATGDLTIPRLDIPADRIDPAAAYDDVRDRWIGLTAPGTDE